MFEDLCRSLFAEAWSSPTAWKNGRLGDEQHGVDVCDRLPYGDWVTVQYKGKNNYAGKAVMPAEPRKEVAMALTLSPKLTKWPLVTAGQKLADVEVLAREITERCIGVHLDADSQSYVGPAPAVSSEWPR
jgi:hypothetical protein